MARLGLSINEAKTSVKDARADGFDFLGYTFGPQGMAEGERYLGRVPREEPEADQRQDQRSLETRGHGRVAEVRGRLNRLLGGWSA